MEKIPILFTTYNRLSYTRKTLPVLLANSKESGKVYVIDNNSTDGTVDYLMSFEDSSLVHVIFNDENKGVGGAMNQFFDIIRGSLYFAKVDNDTLVPEGWLEEMVMVLESENVDFIQAKHFFVASGVKDWGDMISQHQTKKVFGHNLTYRSTVGGSGLVGKCSRIGAMPEDVDKLVGWCRYQEQNNFKSAFYDGVEIEILDIEDYNKIKLDDVAYLVQTGRLDINNIPNVSIIIPVIREDRVKDCIAAIKASAGLPDSKYEIVTKVDHSRIGCPKMVRDLTKIAKNDLVMFLGDDTIPQPNFLVEALAAMEKLPDKWGLVSMNDGIQDGEIIATHWLAHKHLLNHTADGDFFYTGYKHSHCDGELTDVAKELGRYIYAPKSKVVHNHPMLDMKFDDSDYRKAYSDTFRNKDLKMYLSRRKSKGYIKLGVAFPLTDEKVYTSFLLSWTVMDKPDYTLLMPQFPGPLHTIRNNLVVQALRSKCTHLLMMDTDQNYPSDVIPKLMSHEKDVVLVNVHRRYPPFDSILYRGELGNYYHVPDEECFSGELVEVDAGGCACILYNTEVFLDIPYPWFDHYVMEDGRVVGEDIDFCSKIRAAGYDIFADTSIQIGHLSTMEITRDFYKLYKKVKGFEWRPPPESLDQETLKN